MRDEEALTRYCLNTNPNLETLEYGNEKDWHDLRQKGIGGSDVGAIMGLNKYTSPYQIYKTKVLGIINDVSDKPAVKKGKTLEPVIREEFFKPMLAEKGFTILPLTHTLVNKKYPWLRANLDGIIIPLDEKLRKHTNCIVGEIKVVTEYAEDNWYKDEYCGIPASYYAQVQEYMLVTETKMAILGALFEKDWEMHYFSVPADEEFQKLLIMVSKQFYEYNMELKIPPRLDAELDKEEITKELDKPAQKLIPSEELANLGRQYKDLAKQIKALDVQKNALLTEITNRYLKGERPDADDIKISLSVVHQSRLDTARLTAEHPDLVKEYKKDTTYTKNNIS